MVLPGVLGRRRQAEAVQQLAAGQGCSLTGLFSNACLCFPSGEGGWERGAENHPAKESGRAGRQCHPLLGGMEGGCPGQSPGPGRELGPAVVVGKGSGTCGSPFPGPESRGGDAIPSWMVALCSVMGESPGSTLTSLRSWLVCHFLRCTDFLF